MQTVNVIEAKSRFSELLSRTAGGERFVIRRREKPIAALVGLDELRRLEQAEQLFRNLALSLGQNEKILDQIADQKAHPTMAAFGLLQGEFDLPNLTDEIYQTRQETASREAITFETTG